MHCYKRAFTTYNLNFCFLHFLWFEVMRIISFLLRQGLSSCTTLNLICPCFSGHWPALEMRLVASFCAATHGSRCLPSPWYIQFIIETHEGSFETLPNDGGQSVNVKFYIPQTLTTRMLDIVLKEPSMTVSRWGNYFGPQSILALGRAATAGC